MMSDITYWDVQMAEKLRELEGSVAQLKSQDAAGKSATIASAERKLQQVSSTTRRTFNMDLRQLDRDAKEPYQVKLEAYDRRIDQLRSDLKWARKELEGSQARKELFGDRKPDDLELQDNVSRDDILKAANHVQDKTEDALTRTLRSANEANDIGDETIQRLAEQTDQIKKIDEGLSEIQSELGKAQDILKSFLKRAATDKLIVIFIVLIVFAFLGLVIYLSVRDTEE